MNHVLEDSHVCDIPFTKRLDVGFHRRFGFELIPKKVRVVRRVNEVVRQRLCHVLVNLVVCGVEDTILVAMQKLNKIADLEAQRASIRKVTQNQPLNCQR